METLDWLKERRDTYKALVTGLSKYVSLFSKGMAEKRDMDLLELLNDHRSPRKGS